MWQWNLSGPLSLKASMKKNMRIVNTANDKVSIDLDRFNDFLSNAPGFENAVTGNFITKPSRFAFHSQSLQIFEL
jgi:hypothetical protein